MNQGSPFNDSILGKDIYILLHLTRYLTPRDLRALGAVNKCTQKILSGYRYFIAKAYLTAIVENGHTEEPTRYISPEDRSRIKRISYIIHKVMGPTLVALIKRHWADPDLRNNTTKEVMKLIGTTWKEIEAPVRVPEGNLQTILFLTTRELKELEDRMEKGQLVEQVHLTQRGELEVTRRCLHKITKELKKEYHTVNSIEFKKRISQAYETNTGYRTLIEKTEKDIAIETWAVKKNILPFITKNIENLLHSMRMDHTRRNEIKTKNPPAIIELIPRIEKLLLTRDLMTLRALCQSSEFWMPGLTPRIVQTMWGRMKSELATKGTGDIEIRLITTLTTMMGEISTYEMTRRLIATIVNPPKPYTDIKEVTEELEHTFSAVLSINLIFEEMNQAPQVPINNILYTATVDLYSRIRNTRSYVEDFKQAGKNIADIPQNVWKGITHILNFSNQLISEIKNFLWATTAYYRDFPDRREPPYTSEYI